MFVLLFRLQAVAFLLMKVSILLKYFMFIKFNSGEWGVAHLIYFPRREITITTCQQTARVKRIQNQLSVILLVLTISVVCIRSIT